MKKFLAFTSKSSVELIWSNYLKAAELKKNQILCSISGGQDSIVNFFIILNFFEFDISRNKKRKSTLKILYFQHFWQLKNFFLPLFLFRISFLFKTPYIVILTTTAFLTENESRNWRRKNSFRICQVDQISNFFTGHTETDLIEKNLNNLFRGTSPKGLLNQNYLSYVKYQSYFFSCFFINSISFLNLKNYNFLDESYNFERLTSFFYIEKKFFNKYSTKTQWFLQKTSDDLFNKFFLIETTNLNSKIFIFEPILFSTKNIKFKIEDCTYQKNIFSSSFLIYSNYCYVKINFHKPIQDFRRSTISELSTFFAFPLLLDLTNYSNFFSRNKIRHEVIPFMKSIFHKKIESSLKNFFHLVFITSIVDQTEIIEYYFLYKIIQFKNINQLTSLVFVNKNLKKTLQSSFLQKLLIDSKNIELTFSQISLIQNKLFF